MKETIKRAKNSVKVKGDMNLACTVQGSIYTDLRERCAKELSKIDADFYPIGGVVPLMEGQKYSDLVKSILYSKKGLDPSKWVWSSNGITLGVTQDINGILATWDTSNIFPRSPCDFPLSTRALLIFLPIISFLSMFTF